MKQHSLFIVAAIITILFAGSIFYYVSHRQTDAPLSTTEEISVSELAEHNQVTDCWILAGVKVFSLTGYLANHPGDTVYAPYCGKNATEPLLGSSPSKDTQKISDQLGPYYIGIIVP